MAREQELGSPGDKSTTADRPPLSFLLRSSVSANPEVAVRAASGRVAEILSPATTGFQRGPSGAWCIRRRPWPDFELGRVAPEDGVHSARSYCRPRRLWAFRLIGFERRAHGLDDGKHRCLRIDYPWRLSGYRSLFGGIWRIGHRWCRNGDLRSKPVCGLRDVSGRRGLFGACVELGAYKNTSCAG